MLINSDDRRFGPFQILKLSKYFKAVKRIDCHFQFVGFLIDLSIRKRAIQTRDTETPSS